jgi:hypothetical protein
MFFRGSRYEDVETHRLTDERGQVVQYKGIRFIPDTPALYGYAVTAGDRLDTIAFEVFQDAERFWRICDANVAMWPPRLTERPGRVIGMPGTSGSAVANRASDGRGG